MLYNEWRQLQGQYLWYHQNGAPRVTVPLDYSWADVYKSITSDADIYYDQWELPCDTHYFTSQIFSAVPHAWLKYKTTLEMFLGTLDGTNINPDVFEAGFTRSTTHTLTNDNNYSNSDKMTESQSGSATQDAHTDTVDNEQRGLNYNQGVQALNNINSGNIGKLGNKYASSINDAIGNSSTTYGKQGVDSETSGASSRTGSATETKQQLFNETITERRINYYDNLAFLRERMDRVRKFPAFHDYFKPLFALVTSYKGDW